MDASPPNPPAASSAHDAPRAGWEHFAHGSDIGVRGFGPTLAVAFAQAARALTAVIADVATVVPKERVEVVCEEPDLELLFMSWLNAIVYRMAVDRMLFSRFDVRLRDSRLVGTLWGEAIDPDRHGLAVEVKGATVTELEVARASNGGWRAGCVVDV